MLKNQSLITENSKNINSYRRNKEQTGFVADDFVADRIRLIPPSGIRQYFGLAEKMPNVISLCIGEPDFPTPPLIAKAGFDAVYDVGVGYTANSGLPELRDTLAEHLESLYSVKYNPEDEIVITVGVSEAVKCVFTAVCNPGDEIIIPEPCFVSYEPEVLFAGGKPVPVACLAENDFEPQASQIESAITEKTKAIFMGFPNNPTGAVLTLENALEIARIAEENDLLVISDEIYDRLVYGVEHICLSSLPGMKDRTILLGGFSKDYAMPGWRVGYMCANAELMESLNKVHQYAVMSAPTISQYAAVAALKQGEPFVAEMQNKYNKRRKFVVKSLNEIGLDCFEPKGAFYAFPSVASTGMNGDEFASKLLVEKEVAVVPGSGFGVGGEDHIRIAYCKSMEQLEIALDRIGEFVNELD